MKTLGIDLASDPANTAACLIEWAAGGAAVRELSVGADDDRLVALHERADATGIDCPFGWPTAFVAFLCGIARPTGEALPAWSASYRDGLRYRITDVRVRDLTGRWPLSVSSDLISVAAFRCQGLLARMGVTDRSGAGRVYEVYPAAALAQWGLPGTGYKKSRGRAGRETIVGGLLRRAAGWLRVGAEQRAAMLETDDALDALIASLNARAAAIGLTVTPEPHERREAQREGWIAAPVEGSLERLASERRTAPGVNRPTHR